LANEVRFGAVLVISQFLRGEAMQKRNYGKRSQSTQALMGAVGVVAAAVCGSLGFASHAGAASINVAMADAFTTTTTGNSSNLGINPVTYTPKVTSIAYAGASTYDAADIHDSGTDWNSVEGVSTAPTSAAVGVQNVLYEQNLSLVDSGDNATGVTLNISAIESNGKSDNIHVNGSVVTGTDSLAANPANSTPVTGSGPDGYGTSGASHNELMTPSWIANGAAEGFLFTLNGLTPNGVYDLYVYGAGSAVGQGGTFTLTDSSGTPTGGGSVTTNSVATALNKSIFTGPGSSTLLPAGGAWNMIQATADGTGSLSFSELTSETTGAVKPAINGFQIDAVPEPTSLGLIGLGGLSLLARRRRSSL
jgi:hypothetical protein